MKVTCISCHKKFDNDKYYGICPKCGAFNRLHLGLDDDHQRFHEMYDNGDVHSEYGKHGQYHEQYDDTTSHAKVSTYENVGSTLYDEEKKGKTTGSKFESETFKQLIGGSMQGYKNKKNATVKGINFVKWFIIIIVLIRILASMINTIISIFS